MICTHAGAASGILASFTGVQAFVGLATITHVTFAKREDDAGGVVEAAATGSHTSCGGGVGDGACVIGAADETAGKAESLSESRGRYVTCGDGGHLLGDLAGATRKRALRDSGEFCSLKCDIS